MQLVFNKLTKVMKIIIQVASNNNLDSNKINKLIQYNDRLIKFTKYTNSLNQESFDKYIKEIFKNVKSLLNYFSTNVVKFIYDNNLESMLDKELQGLPQNIIYLLKAFKVYIEQSNKKLQDNKQTITVKMKEYKDSNRSKTINESISYILLLDEGDNDSKPNALTHFVSGGVGAIKGLFNLFSFRSNRISSACKSFEGSLDKLNSAAIECSKSHNYLQFFTSEGFTSCLGGLLALVLAFAVIKKVFSKLVNGIKNTWNDFWEWTRR